MNAVLSSVCTEPVRTRMLMVGWALPLSMLDAIEDIGFDDIWLQVTDCITEWQG